MAPTDTVSQAELAQHMLDKNVYTAVIVGLVFAVVGLFGWLMWTVRKMNAVQELRIKDRDSFQAKLDALGRDTAQIVQENTKALFVLTRATEELRQNRKGSRQQLLPAATVEGAK